MFPDVWERVVSRRYKNNEALTRGLIRRKIRHSTYPVAIIGEPRHILDGRLYWNVTPADVERLDRFEGKYYQRRQVVVTIEHDGKEAVADAYLLRQKYHLLAGREEWSPIHFQKRELQRFIHTVYTKKFE